MQGEMERGSLVQLALAIQSGALSPVELAERTLDKIRTYSDHSVFTALTPERALAEARACEARLRRGYSLGLLEGIPISWKDLFDLKGRPTTAGSKILADAVPAARDADVVAALRDVGMVCVGLTNMSEFAFSGLGINPHYGTPVNPHSRDVARLPGGSSSGAGVAVAAGLVPVAIGTDTGGSVRIPAAFNGVVGYKASRGRYSMAGVFPLAKSLDSLGSLCQTVLDAVWIDAAMRRLTAPQIQRGDLTDAAFVIPLTIMFDGAEEEVVLAFEKAVSRLEKAGTKIRRAAFPVFNEITETLAQTGALVTAEAFALHCERLGSEGAQLIDPRVVARISLGAKTSLADYLRILETRERLVAEMASLVGPDELLLSPTLPHAAPPIAPLLADDELFFATNAKTLRNTSIGNFLDWCGVSIPCGFGKDQMPVGTLLSGLPQQDERLLSVALAAEPIIRDFTSEIN